jgi:protein-tyrosine phosphatase
MPEITRVWERLYVGSVWDAEALASLNPNAVNTVISLCEEPALRRNPAINYMHVAIADAAPIPVRQFDSIIDALAENIRWGTVLIHCGSGMSRAPIMTAAWMHVVGYMNIDAALEKIAKLRPIVNPSPVLLKSIKEHLR